MKFTNGIWDLKKGVRAFNIQQIREVKISQNEVYLYAVPYAEDRRAWGGPIQEVYISSPQPDIIRLKSYHFKGSNEKNPEFEINNLNCVLDVTQNDNSITIKSGDTSLVITKSPATFTYFYKEKMLTKISSQPSKAYLGYIDTPQGKFMSTQLDLDIGEKVYGFGEKFTPFVKNGQTVDIWNEDGGTGSQISYKNIPFYITNKGYGVFVNSTDEVSFEVCSEYVTKVQFSVAGECNDFMVIGGKNMKEVLQNYTTLTGKPSLPPAWTFGLWLTSSFTTSYDEKTVMNFVNGMKERNIPLSVFHFDCYWMKENEWCNFDWDKNMFADVDGMLGRMKNDKKLKICVWINSYIAQKSPLFDQCKKLGYLLKKPNGDVWQTDLWQAGMGIIDFTNPDAYKWYQNKLRVLLEQGVDCFKTDFGERIPTDVIYFDGSNPQKMHNYYTYLYNKCVFELLEEYKGKNKACLFARSATVGGQKFPVHWGGDSLTNYPSMAESLRGGLSLCMSGFGFWSHDISGFSGTADYDVYKRWLAFGLFSTHSRLHGANSYRVPWLFGEESVDVARFFTQYKCQLMPYIYANAVNTHKTGIPTMRSMVLEFEKDLTCADVDRQYMFGDSIMVAPIFKKDGNVDYYLPKGKWTHLLTNKQYNDCGWYNETYDFFSLPLMVKQNSIIPLGNVNDSPEYDYTNCTTFHIFELDNSDFTIYDTDGKKALQIIAKRVDKQVTIEFNGKGKNIKVLMRNIFTVENLIGATLSQNELGVELLINDKLEKVEFDV